MASNPRNRHHDPHTDSQVDPRADESRIASAAEKALDESSARSKRATSGIFLVLRIALFAMACVFAVIGVMGFIDASNAQTASRLVTMESIQGEPNRHACVIFSYDESDTNVSYERSGVIGVLGRSGVSSDVFYLDAHSSPSMELNERRVSNRIIVKAGASGGYDVVIAVGDVALSYILENRDLFGGVPASFFAVEDADLAHRAQESGLATGYLEEGAPTAILDAATKTAPGAKKAVVLTDGSAEAQGMLKQLEKRTDIAPNVERDIWDVSKMSRNKLEEELGNLKTDSLVLLLSAYHDSEGKVFSPTATAYSLSKSTIAPVFSALGGVGEGICGSAFFDRETEGADAAKMAIDMLNGVKVSDTPVTTLEVSNCVFDVQALEAHALDPNAAPEESAFINESVFSWRVIRPMLRSILFLIAAVVCIAGFGIIGFRRSRISNQAIIASRNDLQYRLYHDLLTDLPNRYALEKFASDPETAHMFQSIAQLDLDDFTDINDSYGHMFGNEVIEIMSQRLIRVKATFLARSGGDEFTLGFDHALTPDSPEIKHLMRIFNDPVIIGDSKLDISARIGIANREENMTGEDMIIFSDLAIHNAKDNNLHHPVFYDESMREGMERKLEITAYLKQAIADENIVVLWQPQVDTESVTVCGYEALCRLEGNKYYPSDFIPVAEMSGLINPLDRIVTKKVIVQLGKWLKEGREVGVASINFSAAQLRDKGYCDFLAEELAINNVPASLIKIEITESMILGNEEDATRLFARLRSMGITLALDDFGTGYSSLYRMAKRPIDVVKLDKSLVDTFMIPGKEGFIDDITRLIHGIDKSIVVEGVETYEQYQMCLEFGCDTIQGYFFAKPMTAEEVIKFDPAKVLAAAKTAAGDKTRNVDWQKYDRDKRGRWTKKS